MTVIIFRLLLARFNGGRSPYKTVAVLQHVMFASVKSVLSVDGSRVIYVTIAELFGVGCGASNTMLAAMAVTAATMDLLRRRASADGQR